MSAPAIRPARPDDKAFLREMLEMAATSTYPDLMRLGRLSRRERLDEIFNYHYAQEGQRIWVATDDEGARLGMVWLVPSVHPVTEQPDHLVLNLAVAPEARGRGVGRALMAHAQAFAAREGDGRLRLFVGAHNAEAVRLYERLGFGEQTREMSWSAPKGGPVGF